MNIGLARARTVQTARKRVGRGDFSRGSVGHEFRAEMREERIVV